MRRTACAPRPDWQATVEGQGLSFHTADDGRPYWDELAYYSFTAAEIDTLEAATAELHNLVLQAVEHVVSNDRLAEFGVPDWFVPTVRQSWERDSTTLYGRFDLAYTGADPPKLLEYNADTPTALLEAAVIQWFWLKDCHPQADQFNSLHERLIEYWKNLRADKPRSLYFTALGGHLEDFMTANYLRDTALQAGWATEYLAVEQIGWNAGRRAFVDLQERPINALFKLYPWEWLLQEQFGRHIPQAATRWLEPPWKLIASHKGLLPVLWELFPDHPNLLAASREPLPGGSYVRKPMQGREGANVQRWEAGTLTHETGGDYGKGPFVYQALAPLPRFDGNVPVLGSWIVHDAPAGMGIREDTTWVTGDASRFVPHLFT